MATTGWRADSSISETLFDRGFELDFFQAVRLLTRLIPERKPVGTTARPGEEVVRFGAWLSLAFPASAIDVIERVPDWEGPPRMTVTFMGLSGIQGVLPVCYTEQMLAQDTAGNDALKDFLDLFNHRFVSLFYRAWEKHCVPVQYEAAALAGGGTDLFTRSLYDLIGLGTPGLRNRMRITDESLLPYAGLVAQRPRSATALRSILRDYFSLPVEIDQCIGSWYPLDDVDRSYLSFDSERNQLGVGAFIGEKVWNQQSKFRLRLGPIDLEHFSDFLPGRPGISKLLDLTRYLVGPSLAFEVQLILQADEVPDLQLTDEGTDGPYLGWSSWLKNDSFTKDASDAVFTYLT
jgi:type VI secretion system protein ImpH